MASLFPCIVEYDEFLVEALVAANSGLPQESLDKAIKNARIIIEFLLIVHACAKRQVAVQNIVYHNDSNLDLLVQDQDCNRIQQEH